MQKPHYIHTQHGVVIVLFAACLLAFIFWMVFQPGSPKPAVAITIFLLMAVMVIFSSLTVIVYKNKIRCQFKGGFISRSFKFQDIQKAESVTNRWYTGWGIRKIPGGWMYNVSGLKAVELTLKNGSKFRIGTDEPQKLLEIIEALGDQSAKKAP